MKNQTFSKGFVVFTTQSEPYNSLANTLVDSILEFSEYEILLAGVGFLPKVASPRVESIHIQANPKDRFDVFLSKFRASLESPFDLTVQLDADMIALPNVDGIFDYPLNNPALPSGAVHPGDPRNQRNIMNYLGVRESTQPYVHGTYLFSSAAKPFLQECLAIGQEIRLKSKYRRWLRPANFDETILNVKLWQKMALGSYLHWFDPYFESYIANTLIKSRYGVEGAPHVIHGQKCVACARQHLSAIRAGRERGKSRAGWFCDAHASFHSE